MTLDCTLKLLAAMPHAPSHVRVVSLAEVGMRSIAHVGAFRPPAQEALWPMFEQALR